MTWLRKVKHWKISGELGICLLMKPVKSESANSVVYWKLTLMLDLPRGTSIVGIAGIRSVPQAIARPGLAHLERACTVEYQARIVICQCLLDFWRLPDSKRKAFGGCIPIPGRNNKRVLVNFDFRNIVNPIMVRVDRHRATLLAIAGTRRKILARVSIM